MDTGELFIHPARMAARDAAARSQFTEAGQGSDRDVVKLQAALLTHGGVLTRDDLADALGWDLQRLEHSLRALHDQLRPTGLRLRRAGWNSYALTAAPAALTTRERQRLHDAASARQPLAPQAVSVLYEVTLGFRRASWHHALLAAEPAALRQLRQRSMVRLAGRNQLEPTEAVLYSLALSPNAREERS